MTPSTSPRRRMGKPNAACSPSRAARGARGKFLSCTTSGIQMDCAAAQTRPGRPTPRVNVSSRLAASKSGKLADGAVQISTQRSASTSRSSIQSAPCSQPSDVQIASRIFGAAWANVAASTRARAATCSAVSRRLAEPPTVADPSRAIAALRSNYRHTAGQGSGFKVQGSRFRFRVQGSGFRFDDDGNGSLRLA